MATSSTHKGWDLSDDRTELRVLFNGTERMAIDATGIGFFQAAPVAQQADIGAITDNSGGTASDTLADVESTYTEATLANNFASLADAINDIRTVLRNLGLMA